MKTFLFPLVIASVMTASAAYAEDRAPAQTPAPASQSASSEAPLGRDGQDTKQFCSKQNRNIEYRDCVNASTRDPNAKVRMG